MPNSRRTPEGNLQKQCIDALKLLGWVVVRQNQHRHKVTPGYEKGVADIICGVRGRFVAIEFKTPDGRQSDDQKAWAKTVKKQNCVYVIIRTLAKLFRFVEEFKRIA